MFLILLEWAALPPIRAESLLIALTNGWPGSTEPGWSAQRKIEKLKKRFEVEKNGKAEGQMNRSSQRVLVEILSSV